MDFKENLTIISDDLNHSIITEQEARKRICVLLGVIGRLSFEEIEMLVKLKHYDDSSYGNDEKRCDELIEATRNKVGYTKHDVKSYL